ncbi:K(+) efflux antiporter 3, chloroplastic-like [Dorcoceras hygrometricum]|uniref:K(+) efflux antiporter 3, chloroplastic-like n=1 Tax=Dorcoceras hygrometricum TaxID=472368 RepID=A0A2Z7CUB5_9LAMI|nr:K(+) efflux antiporter 3, chloroplastic-like [Dorcoceras hygrometricum]
MLESRIQYLCDPQWFRDTASRGPTTIVAPESQFRTCPSDHVSMLESRIQYLCDPQWFRDTASRGPTTIVAPESQFRTCPSDHDSIGYPRMSASGESSTTMHRLLHASGSHPIPPHNDPNWCRVTHSRWSALRTQRVALAPSAGLDRWWRVVAVHLALHTASLVAPIFVSTRATSIFHWVCSGNTRILNDVAIDF